jgi:hypothetical protein
VREPEIHPQIWAGEGAAFDPRGYLLGRMRTLRACLDRAVELGIGLVIDIG